MPVLENEQKPPFLGLLGKVCSSQAVVCSSELLSKVRTLVHEQFALGCTKSGSSQIGLSRLVLEHAPELNHHLGVENWRLCKHRHESVFHRRKSSTEVFLLYTSENTVIHQLKLCLRS